MPRRLALDEIKRREVGAILAMGCSRATAAKYVGCAASTILRTSLRDRAFRDELRRAESSAEVIQLRHIHTAGKKNWRAAAWMLERKFPEQYAQRAPGTVTREQIARLLSEFAGVVIEEVNDPASRRRILERLNGMTRAIPTERRKRSRRAEA